MRVGEIRGERVIRAGQGMNADYRGPKLTYNVTTVGGGRQG